MPEDHRLMLPSGQRWVVLQPGELPHVLSVEHHWKVKPGYDVNGSRSEFDWSAPIALVTLCGQSTEGGNLHVTSMSASKEYACANCWRLVGGW